MKYLPLSHAFIASYIIAIAASIFFTVPKIQAEEAEYIVEAPSSFVKRNMVSSKNELAEMKKQYRERFGDIPDGAATQLAEAHSDLLKTLAPVEITWAVTKPPVDFINQENALYISKPLSSRGINKNMLFTMATGVYKTEAILSWWPINTTGRHEQSYQATSVNIFAADDITAQLLHLPRRVGLKINTSFKLAYSIDVYNKNNKPGDSVWKACCSARIKEADGQEICSEHFPHHERLTGGMLDPRSKPGVARKLGFSLLKGKASWSADDSVAMFSHTGKQNIGVIYKNTYNKTASVKYKNQCVSGGEQVGQYQSAGLETIKLPVVAVSVKGILLEGYGEIALKKNRTLPAFDFFRNIGFGGLYTRTMETKQTIPPKGNFVLDWGDAGSYQKKLSSFTSLPLKWIATKSGPFFMDRTGKIENVIGIGKGERQLPIGDTRYRIIQPLTANSYQVKLRDGLGDHDAKPGEKYTVVVEVNGPANMKRYQAEWGSGFGNSVWQDSHTSFSATKSGWITKNSFKIDMTMAGSDPKNIKITVKKAKQNDIIAFSYTDRIRITGPVIDSLKLITVRAGEPESEEKEVALFYPNFSIDNSIVLLPKAVLKDGSEVDIDAIGSDTNAARILLKADTPQIVKLDGLKVTPEFNIGETMVTAIMGGKDLDPTDNLELSGKKLISTPVKITVNQLKLSYLMNHYTLQIIGPATITGDFQAVWFDAQKKQTSNFIQAEDGVWFAEYDGENLKQVEVIKQNTTVAMLRATAAGPAAIIQIMPLTPPVSIVKHNPLGDLETSSQCRDRLSRDAAFIATVQGQDLRLAAKNACKGKHRTDKATSKLTKKLMKKDQFLVTIGKSVPVTARTFYAPVGAKCIWSIENGGSLTLDKKITPLTTQGLQGNCSNIINGFTDDYDLDAKISVQLRQVVVPKAMGAAPVVVKSADPVPVSRLKHIMKNFNR